MTIQMLPQEFTVCKISSLQHIDLMQNFTFLSKTDDEISLVCESAYVPTNIIVAEPNWKGLRVSGVLDFGMIGVIAKISNVLAAASISIFVVSTYNTDYIFVKTENYDKCTQALTQAGYEVK